jgi:diacylglycerol kinase family enzyme
MLALNMAKKLCIVPAGSTDALGQDAVIPLEVVGKLLEDADELGANGLPLGLRVLQALSGYHTLAFRPSVGLQK